MWYVVSTITCLMVNIWYRDPATSASSRYSKCCLCKKLFCKETNYQYNMFNCVHFCQTCCMYGIYCSWPQEIHLLWWIVSLWSVLRFHPSALSLGDTLISWPRLKANALTCSIFHKLCSKLSEFLIKCCMYVWNVDKWLWYFNWSHIKPHLATDSTNRLSCGHMTQSQATLVS